MRLSKDELGNLLERTGLKGIVEELRPLPEKAYDLSADNPSLKEHIVQVYPKTLEDVRALVGTSLEDGRRHREQMNLPEYLKESCALAENRCFGILPTGSYIFPAMRQRSSWPKVSYIRRLPGRSWRFPRECRCSWRKTLWSTTGRSTPFRFRWQFLIRLLYTGAGVSSFRFPR